MKKVDTPNCETCRVLDDVQHLLVDCVKYHNQRNSLIWKYNFDAYDVGLFIFILSNPNTNAAIDLFKIFWHNNDFLCL